MKICQFVSDMLPPKVCGHVLFMPEIFEVFNFFLWIFAGNLSVCPAYLSTFWGQKLYRNILFLDDNICIVWICVFLDINARMCIGWRKAVAARGRSLLQSGSFVSLLTSFQSRYLCCRTSLYRVTRYVVNDFKWQISYVTGSKYLLSCHQRLGKFNAIMCAKYHNRPLLTWFIRANIVTSPTVVSGQRPYLTLTFFVTLLCNFSVVLYKWVL